MHETTDKSTRDCVIRTIYEIESLLIDGNVDLGYSDSESLPDDLIVNGWLDLTYTKIERLPNNLIVRGDLMLNGTNITLIPQGTVLGGRVYTDKQLYVACDVQLLLIENDHKAISYMQNVTDSSKTLNDEKWGALNYRKQYF